MVDVRNTRQRRAVSAVLDELEGFASAQPTAEGTRSAPPESEAPTRQLPKVEGGGPV